MSIVMWHIFAKPLMSQVLFRQGWIHRLNEDWTKATEKYEKALLFWPYDVEIHYRNAYAYVRANRIGESIEKYKNVITLAPDYGSIHRNIGVIYMINGDNSLAAKHLRKANQINPYDAVTLHKLTILKEKYDN